MHKNFNWAEKSCFDVWCQSQEGKHYNDLIKTKRTEQKQAKTAKKARIEAGAGEEHSLNEADDNEASDQVADDR